MIIEQDLEQYLQRHYQYEGIGSLHPLAVRPSPDWVENSPLLKPKRNAS